MWPRMRRLVTQGNTRPTKPFDRTGLRDLSDYELAELESANEMRVFNRLVELAEVQIAAGRLSVRPSMLLDLNRLVLDGLDGAAGQWRPVSIGIGNSLHTPPPPEQVPALIEDLCDVLNGDATGSSIHKAAYALWRINWIHPFVNGNGRTARAVCYMVLCISEGGLLQGRKTVPDLIKTYRQDYWDALEDADANEAAGESDVAAVEEFLDRLVIEQLRS